MAIRWIKPLTIIVLFSISSLAHCQISIESAWAKATFPGAPTGAVYVTVINHSDKSDKLVGAEIDSTIATDTQLHHTLMNGEMMQMRQLTNGIEIAAGDTMEMKPGGRHIMLIGLKTPLKEGDVFPLILYFRHFDPQTVKVTVKPIDFSPKRQHNH